MMACCKSDLIQYRGRIRSIYGISHHFTAYDDVEKNALFLQNSLSKQCLLDVPRFLLVGYQLTGFITQ
jgi:hypothetical protein